MTHKSTLQSNHGGVVLIGVVEVLQLHIWAKIKGLNRRESGKGTWCNCYGLQRDGLLRLEWLQAVGSIAFGSMKPGKT